MPRGNGDSETDIQIRTYELVLGMHNYVKAQESKEQEKTKYLEVLTKQYMTDKIFLRRIIYMLVSALLALLGVAATAKLCGVGW